MEGAIKFLFLSFTALTAATLLAFSIVGQKGDPISFQKEKDTRQGGPFELSNSNSRYALTEAIVEDKTFFLDQSLAKFASPDVVDYKGKFFSIFTPGVSFLGLPFYLIGKWVGLPQLLTYLSVTILAFLNLFLVVKLTQKFCPSLLASLLSGFIFLFATNALAYSTTFTQHHLSVTIILLSLLNALEKKRTWAKNIFLGFLLGASLLTDIPNLILLLPILFYVSLKHFQFQRLQKKLVATFNLAILGIILGLTPLIFLFAWYNYQTTESYIKTGQTIGRSHFFREELPSSQPKEITDKKPVLKTPFNPRNELNGLYILLLSNERSWLYYSPIVLLGFWGIFFLYKNKATRDISLVILSMVTGNIALYAMFGDPWGGWAFGPRYLIPASALLCASLGVAAQKLKKNLLFTLIFLTLLAYSIGVSSLGALTTTAIPPKVEAVNLKPRIPYTYQYNLKIAGKNQSTSLLYNVFLSDYLRTHEFIILFSLLSLTIGLTIYALNLKSFIFWEKDKEQ